MNEKINQPERMSIDVGSYVEAEFDDGDVLKLYLDIERTTEYDDAVYEQVSIDSPIGKAIVGHNAGDRVAYRAPSGAEIILVVRAVAKTRS